MRQDAHGVPRSVSRFWREFGTKQGKSRADAERLEDRAGGYLSDGDTPFQIGKQGVTEQKVNNPVCGIKPASQLAPALFVITFSRYRQVGGERDRLWQT
jgi:hypothetical protein